jgi:hypothetical protein
MRTALSLPCVPLVAATLLLTAGGCHTEEDCPGEKLPAGVDVQVLPTKMVSEVGCNGLGAALGDDPIGYTTDDPIKVGAHDDCPTETLAPPDVQELYGVNIDFCSTRPNGFTCEGHLARCAEQSAVLEVGLLFRDLPAGSPSIRPYFVYITADQTGDCPRVQCEQAFDATTTRL